MLKFNFMILPNKKDVVTIETDFLFPCRTSHLFDTDWLKKWHDGPQYTFKRGEHISYPNKLENELYLVVTGNVSIGHLHADGKECVLGILQAGDFVDLPSVFSDKESEVYATALTNVKVVKVPKKEIIDKVIGTPQLSHQLLAYFSNQLQEVVMILEQVAYDKVEERLIRALQRLIDPTNDKDGWYPLPKYITHKDIASMIASTRETVTFLINKMIVSGVLKNEGNQLWVLKD